MQAVYAEYLLTAGEYAEFERDMTEIYFREDDALNLEIAFIADEQRDEIETI